MRIVPHPKTGKAIGINRGKHLKEWTRIAAWTAKAAMGKAHEDVHAFPVRVWVCFFMRNPLAQRGTDIDKMARALLDALTGVVYVDDSQVATLEATKLEATSDSQVGTMVEIEWSAAAREGADAKAAEKQSRPRVGRQAGAVS